MSDAEKKILLVVLSAGGIFDMVTTFTATRIAIGTSGLSWFPALVTTIIIGLFLYWSKEIHNNTSISLKILWLTALIYDLGTSFIGNQLFFLNKNEITSITVFFGEEQTNFIQILIIIVMTLFSTSSVVLLSYLRKLL